MRMAKQEEYGEIRDALSREWFDFFAAALPDVRWLPIPNLGIESVGYFRDFELDGLVLTGGDDFGADPVRDVTENALLGYCCDHGLPALGVCRGMQMIHRYFGGRLKPCDPADHVATRHTIHLTPDGRASEFAFPATNELSVNSFHRWSVPDTCAGVYLQPLAFASDGSVEAFRHIENPIIGIAWHPEREASPMPHDEALFRGMFGDLRTGKIRAA